MCATAALSSSTTLSAFFAAASFCSTLTSAESVSPTFTCRCAADVRQSAEAPAYSKRPALNSTVLEGSMLE
eukprot:8149137-Alexandrium_andersonii.AAC.1